MSKKDGLLLGIYIHFAGDQTAGIQPSYEEYESEVEFIKSADKILFENGEFYIDCSIDTFQKAVEFWKEEGYSVGIIRPEWCEKHKRYWAYYDNNSDVNQCPDCYDEKRT